MPKLASFVLALFALVVCATQSGLGVAQQMPPNNPAYPGGTATRDEDAALQALLNESYGILQSDLFRSNLNSLADLFPAVFLRVDRASDASRTVQNAGLDDLAGIIQARPPFRYVRAPVALVGDSRYSFALAGITGDNVHASFSLGRANFSHWLSTDMVRRSCAINTAAHELSHLVSSDAEAFRFDTQPIRDDNAATWSGTNPIASYLVGSAAQCTWLQKNNYTPAVDFRACLQVFGTRAFNHERCTEFGQNREIRVRSGLAPEHLASD